MRARFRSIAALLLPVAASVAFLSIAQGNTAMPAHHLADSATTTVTATVPAVDSGNAAASNDSGNAGDSGDSGDGFSWG
ncbi:hypothetical protein [Streptomyces sp. NPDC048361]|uniref:hypothetical protein n=1 Tax=Streptomyces sp. NPDC048361 TaxID=3154720 RepID=UPI0034474AFC